MKVKVKESYRKAEEEFYRKPEEERKNLIFFSCVDFIPEKEYEVVSIREKDGWYRIVDESGEEYIFPPKMFDITEE